MDAIIKTKKDKYNILFIGNSYTFFNKSWDIVKKLGEKQGINISVSEITSGGYTLEQMTDINDEYGKKVYEYLTNNKYDIVVMQEQSIRPVIEKEKFHNAVRILHKLIIKNGATPLLYITWGRKEESQDLIKFNLTNKSMTEKLSESYTEIAKELNIPTSPVGQGFYLVNSKYKHLINLYDTDNTHPSLVGSYFLSLIHFCRIFNINPKEVKYKFYNDEKQNILENTCFEILM